MRYACNRRTGPYRAHCLTPPPRCRPQESLTKVLLFNNLDKAAQRKVAREMYERPIAAGEILIQEGDTGACRCWVLGAAGAKLCSCGCCCC